LGDTPGIVTSLQNLGFIALLLGEATEAERLLEETLAVARRSGSDLLLARALHSLGNLASARGEFDRARRCFEHAFAVAIESGVAAVVVDSLVGLGVVLRELGEKERALELVVSALQHPGAEQGGRGVAEQLFVDLKSELPSAATERALARAKSETLAEILEKLQVSPSRLRA
jgi:tetratricopeptide (TPR) repeat protein